MALHNPRRDSSEAAAEAADGSVGPVVLGTLSVQVDLDAERMALESALEAGSKLVVANMLILGPYPLTIRLAPECSTLPHEEDLEAVRDTARRALALGIETELLRVRSPRPVKALLEIARDCRAGLLVFGPERSLIKPRRLRGAERLLRRKAPCLLWIAPDG
jgi:hypothetical protein